MCAYIYAHGSQCESQQRLLACLPCMSVGACTAVNQLRAACESVPLAHGTIAIGYVGNEASDDRVMTLSNQAAH